MQHPDNRRSQHVIDCLDLQPHPEGGWFKEVFRAPAQVQCDDERGPRSALTSIYFLLEAGRHSRWHRVLSDELWIYLEGAPLALWTIDPALRTAPAHVQLGPVDLHGRRPQHVVPAGQWQAAQPLTEDANHSYSLVACAVAPGFAFADFSLMDAQGDEAAALRHHWPALAYFI
ncbi:MAG: cupin domain-containing protein [Comamonadaceae bacterium]|nr:MAG: cupin domain-containing protein [Comamonadaceae bacterium]